MNGMITVFPIRVVENAKDSYLRRKSIGERKPWRMEAAKETQNGRDIVFRS